MAFDYEDYRRNRKYASRLGDAEDDLQDVRRKLKDSKSVINRAYFGKEVPYITNYIDNLNDKIRNVYRELDDIEDDIKRAARDCYNDWKDSQKD